MLVDDAGDAEDETEGAVAEDGEGGSGAVATSPKTCTIYGRTKRGRIANLNLGFSSSKGGNL